LAAAGGDSVRLNPGRWETRIHMVKMEIEGMPPEAKKAMGDMMGKERTVTSCLTREQAEEAVFAALAGSDGSDSCRSGVCDV
jgi:hypothetical protein